MSTTKPPRAFASNVMLTLFGTTTLPVDLLPARRSDNSADPKLVCPSCDEAVRLVQQYACPENPKHGPFKSSDAHRAIEVDGMLRKVTDEELTELKAPTLPTGEASFRVFPAAEVERLTLPGGSVYRARPKVNAKLYHLIVDLVSDRSLAFICELTLRNSQKMFRLTARDGLLTLVELIRPGEFHDIEVASAEYDADLLARTVAFVKDKDNGVIESFDPIEWRNTHRERAEHLVEVKRDPNAAKPDPVKIERSPEDDGLAGLAAMLESKPKPAAKKATKRTTKKAAAKA